ncbi:MAG: DUF1177 domain-containing protein [Sulfolobaceae archaeon]
MILKNLIEVIEILESSEPIVKVREKVRGADFIEYEEIERGDGKVTFLRALVKGRKGNRRIEILGRLGAIQMRSKYKGLVSDADGAIVALTVLFELIDLKRKGIEFDADVSIVTNIALDAKLIPHKPFDFMVPPIGLDEALQIEVDPKAELILSIDSTKGNILAKYNDFALTHVVKEGYILKLSDEVIEIYNRVTGHEVYLVALTTGDLTPIEFPIYHISTIISPWLYTTSPVIGIATTSRQVIPGYVTGVQDIMMLNNASRFCIEMIKFFDMGGKVYDDKELEELKKRIGESNLMRLWKRSSIS